MNNELKNIFYIGYKFGIVGMLSTIFNYSIFAFLYKIISVYYIVSSVIGYVSGLLLGYLLNKNWTFVSQVDKSKSYIIGYIAVYADSGYPPYQYFIDGVLNTNPPPYDTAFFNNLSGRYTHRSYDFRI